MQGIDYPDSTTVYVYDDCDTTTTYQFTSTYATHEYLKQEAEAWEEERLRQEALKDERQMWKERRKWEKTQKHPKWGPNKPKMRR